ncbi:hypothetical protein COOONC_04504 [Cooperia oncophora]
MLVESVLRMEKLHCPLCQVCPSGVLCTCSDSVKSGISCKHAHAWALFYDDYSGISDTPVAEDGHMVDGNNNYSEHEESDSAIHIAIEGSDAGKAAVAAISQVIAKSVSVVSLSEISCIQHCDRICFAALTCQRQGPQQTEVLDNVEKKLKEILIQDFGRNPLWNRCLSQKSRVSRKKVAKMTSEFHPSDIDLNSIQICAICEEMQLQLESLDDEQLMVGADIDWWACDGCQAWVHRDCIMESKCHLCAGSYRPTEELGNPLFVRNDTETSPRSSGLVYARLYLLFAVTSIFAIQVF